MVVIKLNKKSSEKNIADTHDSLQNNSLLLNYADWCGHCQTFKNDWKKVVSHLKKLDNGPNVVQIEHGAHEKMKDSNKKAFRHVTKAEGKNRVLYYPMIIAYKKVGDKVKKVFYEGERNSDSVLAFVKKHFKIHYAPRQKGGNNREVHQLAKEFVDNLFKI